MSLHLNELCFHSEMNTNSEECVCTCLNKTTIIPICQETSCFQCTGVEQRMQFHLNFQVAVKQSRTQSNRLAELDGTTEVRGEQGQQRAIRWMHLAEETLKKEEEEKQRRNLNKRCSRCKHVQKKRKQEFIRERKGT